MKPFLFLLVLIGFGLAATGAALLLFFGYVAYDVLYKPEDVKIITFLLGNIADMKDFPAFTGEVDGKPVSFEIAKPVKIFGLVYLFILGLNLIVTIPRSLLDAGINIIKPMLPALLAPSDKSQPNPNAPPGTL